MKYTDVEIGGVYEYREYSVPAKATVLEKGVKVKYRSFPGVKVRLERGVGGEPTEKDVQARYLRRPWSEYEAEREAERKKANVEFDNRQKLRHVADGIEVALQGSGLQFKFINYGDGKIVIDTRRPEAAQWLLDRLS